MPSKRFLKKPHAKLFPLYQYSHQLNKYLSNTNSQCSPWNLSPGWSYLWCQMVLNNGKFQFLEFLPFSGWLNVLNAFHCYYVTQEVLFFIWSILFTSWFAFDLPCPCSKYSSLIHLLYYNQVSFLKQLNIKKIETTCLNNFCFSQDVQAPFLILGFGSMKRLNVHTNLNQLQYIYKQVF